MLFVLSLLRHVDSIGVCTKDIIGQFCGRDLTNYIKDKVMKPFRSYLSCDNEAGKRYVC